MHRDAAVEGIASQYPRDPETQDPVGATAVDRHTINALRNAGEHAPVAVPEWTLEDARLLYMREHLGGESHEDRRRAAVRLLRIVGMVRDALGGVDPVLVDLTRDDARNVRDHMLDRLKSDGERISPASVTRDLNGLRAVINFAATEFPLPGTFQNPFNKLSVKVVRGKSSAAISKRDPLPPAILKAARERVIGSARQPLPWIWRLLEGTGCRLSEVTGLRVEDVDVTSDLPHIRITWHDDRRIKTDASERSVPLIGDALEAAREAVHGAAGGLLLFPKYGAERGADAASAALMKHIRRVTKDPKHVVHSLRHNMKDRLRLAEVAQIEQDLILGHALEGIGDRTYGGGQARLKATARAMNRALNGAA
ncbi:tyrosine-type recombinase/integrase [Pontibaca salina]|uniref:Tyrosine-type recombinase/integrase n=1 Tax=Pontibaca salina TaxID=2795731 RepID=A0A934HS91_9RHOB|nr:tyrosine-type recombinase/integrase [Pontibaca salina]MBI6629735.1 tyrosine-type recombinase/integrase [Pontibaca salina]